MTTFPPLPGSKKRVPEREALSSERYAFQVGKKDYTLQFRPMTCQEGYNNRQLAALVMSDAYEVSFRLENYKLPDGSVVAGYDTMSVGTPFQVLGIVANAVVDWANRRQPDFLFWQAHGIQRRRLYKRMVCYFAARGSGWHRLPLDPFTGLTCQPGVFWLRQASSDPRICPASSL